MKVKVYNMTSSYGNKIANQFEIYTNEGKYFQSYRSIIAFIDNNNNVFLDEDYWDYSRTTSKYRNMFLGEDIVETRKKIESGEYELTELN
tara:strand:+ start:4611 stop:4880 length:270 start_codon:yes stop_codon:yes gene_type:complete